MKNLFFYCCRARLFALLSLLSLLQFSCDLEKSCLDPNADCFVAGNGVKDIKEPTAEPTAIPKPLLSALSGGSTHNLAINAAGELYAWGNNGFGRLGDGTNTDKNSPVKIGTATNWSQVAAGNNHSLAINTAGELYAWGDNTSGQLGDGTTAESNSR